MKFKLEHFGCFFFHDWGKWEIADGEVIFFAWKKVPCMMQVRECRRCGRTQTESL